VTWSETRAATRRGDVSGERPARWSEEAWQAVRPIYDAILEHPFVVQLQSGELDRQVFLRYLLDDARYLAGYARALALVATRLPDTKDVAVMSRSAAGAVDAERLLHATLLGEHGIDVDQPGEPSPTCRHYVSSLIADAATEPVEVSVAAVLPCFRVYAEVGAAIAGGTDDDHPYAAWIATYADPEFAAVVREVEALADRLAAQGAEPVVERMLPAYVRSTRLEWMFWDAAWRGEEWPAL
jgi:thiaminase (transcriptional activator TenA)